jgi:hypothetical protein
VSRKPVALILQFDGDHYMLDEDIGELDLHDPEIRKELVDDIRDMIEELHSPSFGAPVDEDEYEDDDTMEEE